MAEKSETVHAVIREDRDEFRTSFQVVRVSDDRKDARAYAARMNQRAIRYYYFVQSCKKL